MNNSKKKTKKRAPSTRYFNHTAVKNEVVHIPSEGKYRLRTDNDPPPMTSRRTKYVVEFLGTIYTPDEFRVGYCPEYKLKMILKHKPVFEPDVLYTHHDLLMETKVLSSKRKHKIAKARRDRVEKPIIVKKLII